LRHHAGNPLHADWVVVDEASMIDLEMMAALLGALSKATRLVLLGDKDQLASVEAGAVLGDLCREAGRYRADTVAWIAAMAGEDVRLFQGDGGELAQHIALLRVSHRFQAGSGIGRLAQAVNAGDAAAVAQLWERQPPCPDIARIHLRDRDDPRLGSFATEGGGGHFPGGLAVGYRHYLDVLRSQRPAPGAAPEAYAQWAGAVLRAFGQFQLLCALRRGPWGVEGLNRRIADTLCKAGLVEQAWGWYEGRPVLVTRNDYSLGLMNGDIGVALRFAEGGGAGNGKLRVVFRQPDRSIKQVLPSRLTDIETVYAMTVHKSQGSEFAHVGLVLPDKANPVLTRELAYTGITRAKQWFSLLAPDPALLAQAAGKPVRRSGGLAECLLDKGAGEAWN
jgi:exodeoxyribonuclease V alpha subunit